MFFWSMKLQTKALHNASLHIYFKGKEFFALYNFNFGETAYVTEILNHKDIFYKMMRSSFLTQMTKE